MDQFSIAKVGQFNIAANNDFQTGDGGHLLSLIGRSLGHHPKHDFAKTVAYAAMLTGAAPDIKQGKPSVRHQTKTSSKTTPEWTDYQKKRMALARRIERESMPIQATLAERYLREHRGITCSLPSSLRYHSHLYEPHLKKHYPALIAIAKNEHGLTQAVQVIYLDRTTANKANIETNKIIIGPSKGTLVTLQEGKNDQTHTLIAKGLETGLSLKMADKDAQINVTLGVSNYQNINPQQVNNPVIFCLDNDGANSMSVATANKGMQRLIDADKTVFFNQPNEVKSDYNDILKSQGITAIWHKIASSQPYPSHPLKQFTFRDDIDSAPKPIKAEQNRILSATRLDEKIKNMPEYHQNMHREGHKTERNKADEKEL